MQQNHTNNEPHSNALKDIIKYTIYESVADCYQCGKCTAGCPLGDEMDIAPNQILRMLQLDLPGFADKVLGSLAIWLCLSCETCVTRCPQEVDLPVIMDYLRHESLRRGLVNPKAVDILSFHKAFLDQVRNFGRLYEVGLLGDYKLRTMHFLQDLTAAPGTIQRGKLNFLPHKIHNSAEIGKIFRKCETIVEVK
jgi:heterodisulfide reductase subunit C2